MFKDYRKEILDFYIEKKNQLPDNLKDPTQAKLREESLSILENRYLKQDDQTIKAFFDPKSRYESHERSIEKLELDGYKSIYGFLHKEHNIRKKEYIEFLAWLLDFQPRPYSLWNEAKQKGTATLISKSSEDNLPKSDPTSNNEGPKEASTDQKDDNTFEKDTTKSNEGHKEVLINQNDETQPNENKHDSESGDFDDKNKEKEEREVKKINRVIKLILGVILLVEGAIAYFAFYHENTFLRILPAKKECMYWTGDHYEAVSCDSVVAGQQNIIPFNLDEWKYLRKITRPDTLTENDIGKVWYIKIKNDPEFFTFNGRYPLDTNRVLKPLSQHIHETYIPKKKEVALLRNRLISGGIAFVVTLSVGIWWFFVALIRRRKRL